MERATAIKTLGKMLGKSFGYSTDSKAPLLEERQQAREAAKVLTTELRTAEEAEAARRKVLLDADAEYQLLRAEVKRLRDAKDAAWAITNRFKITVGTSDRMFFHVRAQGDSWEDVIAQLRAKEVVR